jgi:hypothetical protein
LSQTQVNITYDEILKDIDKDIIDESERQEVKNILEEIKYQINSKRIPDSTLFEKMKKYEKISDTVFKWAIRGIGLAMQSGYLNL